MYIFLLIFTLSLVVHAADVPFDSSCVETGKKWGWIKNYDPQDGHKRVYQNWKTIKKDLANSKIQDKVIKQLSLWEEIDKKAPCLKTYAGVRFQKGALFIDDMDKFRTFRLSKNLLECPTDNLEWDRKEKQRLLFERYRGVDNTRTWATKMQQNSAYEQIEAEFAIEREKLFKNIQANNVMGDVGLENYCLGQLKTGILIDQARTVTTDLKRCDTARKNGNTKILTGSGCAGYPVKMKKTIDGLRQSVDNLKKEEPGWQPLIKVTKADNDIYSSYKNDYAALLEAQKLATLSLKNSYASDKYMLANNITHDIKDVGICASRPGEEAVQDQFERGVQCTDYKSITNLVTDFNTNIDIVKSLHRDNLLEELNVHAFQEAMKSKYYLLDDKDPEDYELKTNMYNGNNDPKVTKKTCDQIAGPGFCKGPYLEAYRKGVKEAADFSSKTRHFLSYESKWLADYYNARSFLLRQFCDDYKTVQENQLMSFEPGWEKNFQTLMLQMTNGPMGPYFNIPAINSKAGLSDFKSGPEYCKGFDENHDYKVTEKDIDDARAEFKDATTKQIKRTAEFSSPDRGSPSNVWGKMACHVPSMKIKNDMYALNSLFKSHAFLTGKILKSMSKTERQIYSEVLCEAKKCDYQVDSFNDDVTSAVKVLAIATNFIPYVGPVVYTGITTAIEVRDVVRKAKDAEDDFDNLMGGVVSDGVDEHFSGTMGDLLQKLSWDKNPALLTDEIARTVLVNLAQLGVSQGLIKPLASKLTRDIATQLVLRRGIPLSNFENQALEVIVSGTLVGIQELTKKGFHIGTKKGVISCLEDTKNLIVTVTAKDN